MATADGQTVRHLEQQIVELQQQVEALARIVSALVQRLPGPEQAEILQLVSMDPRDSGLGS